VEERGRPEGAAASERGCEQAPVAGCQRSAARTDRAAWRRPDAASRTVRLVFGELPAPAAAVIHLTEVLVHGVDLAVATGQTDAVDQALCEELLGLMEATGGVDAFRVPGIFGPAQPVAAGAGAHLRLLGYLGRPV
jgi:uncharacterized protein (TIGR03086 family)